MGIIESETAGLHVSFKNKGNGVILMEFDTKDTSTALEFKGQGKNECRDPVKISENQVTKKGGEKMYTKYHDSLIGSGWENSFIVRDVFGTWDSECSTIEKIKSYSFAGCVLDADSTSKDLESFVLEALEKNANFIVIDFHCIYEEEDTTEAEIKDMRNFLRKVRDRLEKEGYYDTQSYEFRLGYFKELRNC